LAEGIPLDEVEVLHPDAETFVPLFYSLSKRYFADPERPSGIPMTFAEGLPVAFSRPGRALALWLRWIEEDFPQGLLVDMLANGLVQADADLGHSYLAHVLRSLPIGGQADSYLPKFDARMKALQHDAPEDADRAPARQRELDALKALRKVVARMLKLSKSLQAGTTAEGLAACADFLAKVARSVNELDRYATEAILEQIAQQQFWLDRLELKPSVRELMMTLVARLRVLGSGPRPGHLHLASVDAGGHSGRRETFVVGLDDRRFPGAGYQDPVLLDRERAKVSDQLPLSAARLQQREVDLGKTLARLRGRVTLSWPCHDLVADRALFPASAALSAYRLISGHAVDLHGLAKAVGLPASFAPATAEQALDESDWWLWKLSDPAYAGQNQRHLVEARYPHLDRGAFAAAQRSDFADYNGYVPQAGADANPFAAGAQALSASALESAGRCPRLYYFRHVLRLYLPDEHELDYDQWLNAAQFGQLMHDIFRRFMSELAAANERPQFDRHHHRLAALVRQVCDEWRAEIPPASANAFRTQVWRVLRTAKVFLESEETHCRASRPRYFEVAIGADPVGDGTPLDRAEPIAIVLPGGERILLRGQVDRIDELAAASFALWDYKISSGYGYDAANPFRQGRRVQNALYLHLIEKALKSQHDSQAHVASFGYFFPSVKTRGLRIEWPAAALADGLPIVERLCQLIAAGAFPATSSRDDCTFCDYQSVCGDVGAVTAVSQQLLARTDLVPLAPYRELRGG
jgi:ATP-dependent helicase/nuclease subunit B